MKHPFSIWQDWAGMPLQSFWIIFLTSTILLDGRRRGRPRSLFPDGYLGLLLFYLGSSMNYKHLCIIFGITPSVCSRAINWMLKKTVRALRVHPFARIQFPSREKMREYAAMVQEREPLVDDIIGFMDGVSFPAECTDDHINQNAMYCGQHNGE